jgi:hypothetical protein
LLALSNGMAIGCQRYEMVPVEAEAVALNQFSLSLLGKPLPSTVMLAVDMSGSMTASMAGTGMHCTLDGTIGSDYDARSRNPCKWNDLKEALAGEDGFLTQSDGLARFGLIAFPGSDIGNSCAPGRVVVPIGDSVEPVRAAIMNDLSPSGGTPTADALRTAAREPLLRTEEPGRSRFVILLTDGLPNCNPQLASRCEACRSDPNACHTEATGCRPTDAPFESCQPTPFDGAPCVDDASLIEAITALREFGVYTLVIGFGSETADARQRDILNRASEAGGKPRQGASDAYYQASSVNELYGILEELLAAFPCTFELDPAPSPEAELNVILRDNERSGSAAERILVQGQDWSLSEARASLSVVGEACALIQRSEVGRYEVRIFTREPL